MSHSQQTIAARAGVEQYCAACAEYRRKCGVSLSRVRESINATAPTGKLIVPGIVPGSFTGMLSGILLLRVLRVSHCTEIVMGSS